MKYFTNKYKKAKNLGKFILSPEIQKRLSNVPGSLVILNCGTPSEKASEFLYQITLVMQKDYACYAPILVTADLVGLYPSIPHEAGSNTLKKALDNREYKTIHTQHLVNMTNSKNNLLMGKIKHQTLGIDLGTRFAPAYACIFMGKIETDFPKTQQSSPLEWYLYIDDVFFVWTHKKQKLKSFLEDLNNYHPNITFTHEFISF